MWVPDSAAELERALSLGGLEETATFEGKREIGKNEDVAVESTADPEAAAARTTDFYAGAPSP